MSKIKCHFLILGLLTFGIFGRSGAEEVSGKVDCRCETISCGPCERETDIKFYSEKCGENLTRIKSCKRPLCEPVSDQEQCLAALGIAKSSDKVAGQVTPDVLRSPSSQGPVYPAIGIVEIAQGKASIYRDNQNTQIASKGVSIYENDRIITESEAKVKVVFTKTGDELHVGPGSNLFIQKFLHPNEPEDHPEYKKTLLKLDFGKVRVRLAKEGEKYDKEKNTFEVKTKTAVAGVRGTDFVVSYDENTKASEVDTLAGAVEMMAQNSGESSGNPMLVTAGEACSTSVKLDFSEISSIKKLDAKTLRSIDQSTDIKALEASNKPAAKPEISASANSASVCDAPSADFKECAWFCEGNPKKEKKCRTDLKEVSCIRKMCGANGQWILPVRMPSSEGSTCDGEKPVKGACGNFW